MNTPPTTRQQIIDYLDRLSPEDQKKVLAFVRTFSTGPKGLPGKEFIEFFRQFPITKEEAVEMSRILEEMAG